MEGPKRTWGWGAAATVPYTEHDAHVDKRAEGAAL